MAISPHLTLTSRAPPRLLHPLLFSQVPPCRHRGPLQLPPPPWGLPGPEHQFRSPAEIGLVLPGVGGGADREAGEREPCREEGSEGEAGGAPLTPRVRPGETLTLGTPRDLPWGSLQHPGLKELGWSAAHFCSPSRAEWCLPGCPWVPPNH